MQRNNNLDFIRAILIVLMILIHIVSFGDTYPHLKAGILSFMMPTFLIITGYLVNTEKDLRAFARYMLCLAAPYTIMVTGFSVLSFFLPVRDGITELTVSQIAYKLFVTSIGPYWFIQTMIVCGILYYASFRWLASKCHLVGRLLVLGTLLLLVGTYTPILSTSAAFYYFLGLCIRQCHVRFESLFPPSPLAIIPWALLLMHEDHYEWDFIAVLLSCWCCLSFITWVSSLKLPHGVSHTLLYIGRNTLPIYLFHPIFTMAAKFYKPWFSFDPTEILLALITIILAIAGSIAIAKVMEISKLAYLFGKPKILR